MSKRVLFTFNILSNLLEEFSNLIHISRVYSCDTEPSATLYLISSKGIEAAIKDNADNLKQFIGGAGGLTRDVGLGAIVEDLFSELELYVITSPHLIFLSLLSFKLFVSSPHLVLLLLLAMR
jgi:hypothetical protein